MGLVVATTVALTVIWVCGVLVGTFETKVAVTSPSATDAFEISPIGSGDGISVGAICVACPNNSLTASLKSFIEPSVNTKILTRAKGIINRMTI